MANNRDRIMSYLGAHTEGGDDDELSTVLQIYPRQQVNQMCNSLKSQGVVCRDRDWSRGGKIVNRLTNRSSTGQATTAFSITNTHIMMPESQKLPESNRVVLLNGEAAVRQFGYDGELGTTEDQVKRAVATALLGEGWEVDVRWGHERGVDIVALRGGERLVIEAKGEGSLQPMRVNYFLGALGELLQRMDSPDDRYGLALPAHRQFMGLVLRLPVWVRQRLQLSFYFVRPSAPDAALVALLPPPDIDRGA